jgi:hypothetical protein
MNARTAAQAIAQALNGEATIAGLYLSAYSACADAQDAGVSLRDIADECKALGIKANKDTVGDFALAAVLTLDADAYHAAIAQVYGAGSIVRAHVLVGSARACKGQGISVVRAILAPVTEALESDTAEVPAAVLKAVKALKAVKPVAKKDDEGQGDEGDEEGDAPEQTPEDRGHALASALIGPATALRDEILEGTAALTEADKVALMQALASLAKVAREAA